MLSLAIKNLFEEKGRLAIGICGVAFANILIIFQLALVSGTFSQITKYIDRTKADIWALQEGLSDITSSTSFISSSNIPRIEAIEGVEQVIGLFLYYTSLKINTKTANVFLVGFDAQSGIGGPWAMHSGQLTVDDNHIIMDNGLAASEGLRVGDSINISGHTTTIAGLSDETSAVATRYVFVSREAIARYLNLTHIYNYLLVVCEPGAEIEQITTEISAIKGIDAYSKRQLAKNTLHFWGEFLIPLLSCLLAVSLLVGAVIIGIIVYTLTLHKEKEYGILRALGAGTRQVYAVVMYQAAILGAIGLILGAIFSAILIHIANKNIPGMTAELSGDVVAISFLLTLVMVLFSIIVPLRRIVKIDPFEVFRR